VNGIQSSGLARILGVALVCFGLGGATVYLVVGRDRQTGAAPHPAGHQPSPQPTGPAASAASGEESLGDVTVPVTADLVERAGIRTAAAARGAIASVLRVPATVTPNQYQQVQVAALVGGQITQVWAQLGDRVRKGAALAQIFSSDLADAQTRYLSARAELSAADERLQRTTRLVAIGAASQQELEQTQAERTKLATNVEGEAARLRLFGMPANAVTRLKSAADISATVTLSSPAAGVITERTANPGAVIMPSAPLFVISSLSPVWVIAEVSERDLPRVRVGAVTAILVEGRDDVRGKVAYVSPEVRAETRTAQVRIETPNPDGHLRFGMLVSVELTDGGSSSAATVTVPAGAVQSIGGHSFVYLVPPQRPGEFMEREVRVGARSNDSVEILSGVNPGDTVVTSGSFFLRAERERLGLRQSASGAASTSGPMQVVDVAVTASGFAPAKVEVASGTHVKLKVTRKVEATCGTDLMVAGRKATEALPLNQPVEVDLGVVTRGEITFSCGMGMLKGVLIVH
jgi:membrane fusion protein, heavy metal efflux system